MVKIPPGWQQISGPALASALKAQSVDSGNASMDAFEAGPEPKATDFLAFGVTHPFMFIEYGTLTSTAHRKMSYGALRDFFLPVTSTGRQKAVAEGLPLTGFREIRDQTLTLTQGVHGVRETYEYTDGGQADTFDMDALTNAGQTAVFLVVIHCTITCYSKYQIEIRSVMSSVAVSGFGQPQFVWTGLVGR